MTENTIRMYLNNGSDKIINMNGTLEGFSNTQALDSAIDEATLLNREVKRLQSLLEGAKLRVKEEMAKAGFVKRITPLGSRALIYTSSTSHLDREFLATILSEEVLEKATKRGTSICLKLT